MPATTTATTPARVFNQCQHIFNPASHLARRCGLPALRGETHCYFHHPTRKPSVTRHARRGFKILLPRDRRSLQSSLLQVIHRLAANQIDPHRASLLLYALQISSKNIR